MCDRTKRRVGIFSKTRVDNYWHKSQSASGLDGIRERLRHPLFRLQRYISVKGARASQRQYFRCASGGASGPELITAIALAYEVQCRFCDAASIRARGWDHVTYGTFSTALACAH